MTGKLYIVPTPIGNLEDMTFRAVKVLQNADIIAAEDTRTSAVLMRHYNIKTHLISYHKFNEKKKSLKIIEYLQEGKDVAVITDAGTPGVSDPAEELIKSAIDNEIQIIPLPGAAALIPAFTAADCSKDNFLFLGFLSSKTKEAEKTFKKIAFLPYNIIIYESPKRVVKTLELIGEILGSNRKITLAKEISKKFEHFFYGSVIELLGELREKNLKGEWVIVIAGINEQEIDVENFTEVIKNEMISLLKKGNSKKDSVKILSEKYDIKKNFVYEISKEI